MEKFKVLNLYACLGGNRKLWNDCEVTAVEIDPVLCEIYKRMFPDDIVICGDAKQYLLENFSNFDFIWASPSCITHSKARKASKFAVPVYPDFSLYEIIVFLKHYAKCKWIVENVIPYYDVLIPGVKRGRHMFWSNFLIPSNLNFRISPPIGGGKKETKAFEKFHGLDLSDYNGNMAKRQLVRNLLDFEAGKVLFDAARNIFENSIADQTVLDFEYEKFNK